MFDFKRNQKLLLLLTIVPLFTYSEDNSNFFYDPRSEFERSRTSGEEASIEFWIKQQSDIENDTKKNNSESEIPVTEILPLEKDASESVDDFVNDLLLELSALSNPYGFNHTSKIDQVTFARIKNSADNSILSSYFLGTFIIYGFGSDKSSLSSKSVEATKWFLKASNKGNVDAQCALGLLFFKGYGGVRKNLSKAVEFFRLAATSNKRSSHARAHWLLARALYEHYQKHTFSKSKIDFDEMVSHLEIAVNAKIPEAIHYLALLNEYGVVKNKDQVHIETTYNNLQPNFRIAMELYHKASYLGYAQSSYNLGLMYAYGRGVRQDFTKALEFFRRAAITHHHIPSMRYIGIFATNGYGYSTPDYELALYWFRRCATASTSTTSYEEQHHFSQLCNMEKHNLKEAINLAESHKRNLLQRVNQSIQRIKN